MFEIFIVTLGSKYNRYFSISNKTYYQNIIFLSLKTLFYSNLGHNRIKMRSNAIVLT